VSSQDRADLSVAITARWDTVIIDHVESQMPSGSKYLALRDYLAGCQDSEAEMSFSEVEELVGRLPASARS
jgi:hypothetical protein